MPLRDKVRAQDKCQQSIKTLKIVYFTEESVHFIDKKALRSDWKLYL